jgi:hypothetical protein
MTNTEKMLNLIDDQIISEADGDRVDPRRLVTPDLTLNTIKDLLRKEIALRLAYVTIEGLNPKWYKWYAKDPVAGPVYIQTLKDQLLSLK